MEYGSVPSPLEVRTWSISLVIRSSNVLVSIQNERTNKLPVLVFEIFPP